MILIGVQNLSVRGYPFKQALELMKVIPTAATSMAVGQAI